MVNWIATQALSLVCLFFGFWRSFKLLKDGTLDFAALEFWAVIGVLRLYELHAEWLLSWLPFYYTGKAMAVALLAMPQSRMSGVLFECMVIPFMRGCHRALSDQSWKEQLILHLVNLPLYAVEMAFPGSVFPEDARAHRSLPSDASILSSLSEESELSAAREDRRPPAKNPNNPFKAPRAAARPGPARPVAVPSSQPPRRRPPDPPGSGSGSGSGSGTGTSADFSGTDVSRLVSTHNRLRHIAESHHPAEEGPSPGRRKAPPLPSSVRRRRLSSRPSSRQKENAPPPLRAPRDRSTFAGELPSTPSSSRSERRGKDRIRRNSRRNTLGAWGRELLTGDDRVRIRDHLFDISVNTPPRQGSRRMSLRGKRMSSGLAQRAQGSPQLPLRPKFLRRMREAED